MRPFPGPLALDIELIENALRYPPAPPPRAAALDHWRACIGRDEPSHNMQVTEGAQD